MAECVTVQLYYLANIPELRGLEKDKICMDLSGYTRRRIEFNLCRQMCTIPSVLNVVCSN